MKIETFKKLVKTKFGSMTKFAALIKRDRYELQKLLAAAEKNYTPERKEMVRALYDLAKATPNAPGNNELTPELRAALKARIEEFGGVTAFAETNPEFSAVSLWHVLNGTRKTINNKVKWLLRILSIPIPEENERPTPRRKTKS